MENTKILIKQGSLCNKIFDERLRPLTEEELKEYRKNEPVRERVSLALAREFIDDEGKQRITEEEVIQGFKDFKWMFENHFPHLF